MGSSDNKTSAFEIAQLAASDYNKLKQLILLDGRLKASGNLDVLCELAADGWTVANLVERFPLEELKHRDQFPSLLFYMGILTILQKAISDAKAQLARYATDELVRSECAGTTFSAIAVIYRKWDLAFCEAVESLQP